MAFAPLPPPSLMLQADSSGPVAKPRPRAPAPLRKDLRLTRFLVWPPFASTGPCCAMIHLGWACTDVRYGRPDPTDRAVARWIGVIAVELAGGAGSRPCAGRGRE